MTIQNSATRPAAVAVPGLVWAAVGVFTFSMSFPATVFALQMFDPVLVGAGRSVGAALLAAPTLLLARAPLPRRDQLFGFLMVAAGCGLGFGLLTTIALDTVSSSHAAVVGALLPVATASFAVLRAGERPRPLFWLGSLTGAGAVIFFAVHQGLGELHGADALLLIALVIGGMGYAEGGRLARVLPGWQVVSWSVILALPVALPVTLLAAAGRPPTRFIPSAIAGLLYVSSMSVFVGFFAWYRGLATAGIARASQLQLGQPFLTLGLSAWLLGEHPGLDALVTAIVVILCVAITQWARSGVARPVAQRTPGEVPVP